jgi:[ribosomal protein S5]-alanine N-acetyltransferase
MMNTPELRTERTLSRLVEPSDAPKVLDYFRAAGRRYDPPLPDSLLTLEHWRKHSEQLLKESREGSALRLFVFTLDEAEILGTVGLTRITRGVRFDCSLSYAIRASHEGTGLMGEAVRAAIRHAFDDLGLHRIEASHAPDNHRSGMLLQRLGFERIGTIPGFLLSAGEWRDTVLHSLLNPDWLPR